MEEPPPQARVFGTAELLEMIILHLPLKTVILVQGVNKTWLQAVKASPTLSTALGLTPFGNEIQQTKIDTSSFSTIFISGDLRLLRAIGDNPELPKLCAIRPRWCSFAHAPAERYLAHVEKSVRASDTVPNFMTSSIFPTSKLQPRHDMGGELQYRYKRPLSKPRAATEGGSWRGSYATQPPTTSLVLQPANDFMDVFHYQMLSGEIRKDLMEPIWIVNESGIKIGDIAKTLQQLKPKFDAVIAKVEYGWGYCTWQTRAARGEEVKRPSFVTRSKSKGSSDCKGSREFHASDLWGCFYFKLLVPAQVEQEA